MICRSVYTVAGHMFDQTLRRKQGRMNFGYRILIIQKNSNIRLKSVLQNLLNILEAISNTSNRGFPEIQALQSWYNKLGLTLPFHLLLGVLIADRKNINSSRALFTQVLHPNLLL